MTNRQRLKAVLNYEKYDRMPVVHFGYWDVLLEKWVSEGHLKPAEIEHCYDGSPADMKLNEKLGFDFNYHRTSGTGLSSLLPAFEPKRVKENADGSYEYLNPDGMIVLMREGAGSIPAEVGHTLTDRAAWEEQYLPRLQYSEKRVNADMLKKHADENDSRTEPLGIFCGSLFGQIRNWLGVEGVSYLYADDEDLYDEIINTVGELAYKVTEKVLEFGVKFDFAHFWEDICFKNGPLVTPSVFEEKVGPHYRKISELVNKHGINIVSLDCDGVIDALVPIWLKNGVNTMFPIEVGVWNASIEPWRKEYGKELRGVGGMNKHVLSYDKAAVDKEIERLKPQVALGGFIPCPDHRLPPDTKWELVQYYCDKMKETF